MNINLNFSYSDDLTESGQEARNSYAFCVKEGDDVQRGSPFVKCREYLGDQLFNFKTGTPTCRYGYSSKSMKWDGVHMLLYFQDRTVEEIEEGFDYINNVIGKGGLPPISATPYRIKGKTEKPIKLNHCDGLEKGQTITIWLAEIPEWYTRSLLNFSLWSSLVRLCWYPPDRRLTTHRIEKYTLHLFINHIAALKTPEPVWCPELFNLLSKEVESGLHLTSSGIKYIKQCNDNEISRLIHDTTGIGTLMSALTGVTEDEDWNEHEIPEDPTEEYDDSKTMINYPVWQLLNTRAKQLAQQHRKGNVK